MTQAKLIKNNAGIYLIKHKPSGRSYVGQSNSITKRWNQHNRELISGSHHNKSLQTLWNSSTYSDFKFDVIKQPPTELSSLKLQRWLVNEERKVYLELKEKGIALNEVEPEIVATNDAVNEYQNEIQKSSKEHDERISAKRKAIKIKITQLQNNIKHKRERLFDLELKYKYKSAFLKKSTGWRGLFNAREAGYNLETERELIKNLYEEITNITPEVKSVENEVFNLKNDYRDLYRRFSKVIEKASARSLWYGLGRLPKKTKISE